MNDAEQWSVWHDAAKRSEIDQALRALYAEIDAAVAERGPVCNASGRCCQFEAYGHRLYVTGLEIAWYLQGVAQQREIEGNSDPEGRGVSLPQIASSPTSQSQMPPNCPYQVDGLCSTHAIRPLGCRVYFCEEGTEDWQQDTTERFLDRLKALHVEHGLPYSYREWRMGLADAGRVLDADEAQ